MNKVLKTRDESFKHGFLAADQQAGKRLSLLQIAAFNGPVFYHLSSYIA